VVVHDGAAPGADEAARLAALGIAVRPGPAVEVVVEDDAVTGVRLADGSLLAAGAVVARGPMVARTSFLGGLGLEREDGPVGRHLRADPAGSTEVPGVWVAGNAVDLTANVVMAGAAGARAAGAIHADLLEAEAREALAHAHAHAHGERRPGPAPGAVLDRAWWEDWYAQRDQVWSGEPNPWLVAEAGELAPGRALDVGAGEGADAIWLAERGWRVTAVDIAEAALGRGRAEAARRGAAIADRITWEAADVTRWAAPSGAFQLVALHFVHLGPDERSVAYARSAAAVAPGGTLLVVGHHPADVRGGGPGHDLDRFFTPEELVAGLDDRWEVVAAEVRPRTADRDGRSIRLRDVVLVARRRGPAEATAAPQSR
jgi:SAM-dependent methyltransferase